MSRSDWDQFFSREFSEERIKKYFYKFKYGTAPIYAAEEFLPPTGVIYDLGCGEGVFCKFLRWKSPSRQVVGIDLSENRIEKARRRSEGGGIKYAVSDIAELNEENIADAVSIVHVLYLLPVEKQKRLFIACNKALKMNGRLVILSLDAGEAGTKSILEAFFFALRVGGGLFRSAAKLLSLFHIGKPIAEETDVIFGHRENKPYYQRERAYIDYLSAIGFRLEKRELLRGTPFTYFVHQYVKEGNGR
ncbi:MAG: class I SAM-dependent methyltransferase [Candidatus Omnitrophica bacterium]|nr:class I SAM-dependent methyltransferase [Candidatus Omnitrophota bacterium]